VSGVGPGRAIFIWTAADHQVVYDRYAHDEYLQIAAEDGVVGLVGLALLGAGVAVTARRGWRSSSRPLAGVEPDADLKALRAGVMAGLVCFALHSGFDFLWHLPVLPMIAAVAVGLVAPTAGSGPMSQTQMSQPQMSQPNTQEVQCSTRKAQ
jgi:O-antigen ligase